MPQSIFFEEHFFDKTLNFTPRSNGTTFFEVLPNGGVAIFRHDKAAGTHSLTYRLVGPDGEPVGDPQVLASVPKGNLLSGLSFVDDASGHVVFHYSVVSGTRSAQRHQLIAGDMVETELRVVRLTEDGALNGTQSLANWTGYIPSIKLTALKDGGLAVVSSGEPKGFVSSGTGGSPIVPDPDSLLQRYDVDGNAVGEPIVWSNPGQGYWGYLGYEGGGTEVADLLRIYQQADDTALIILPEPFDPTERNVGDESPAFIYSYTLQADGSLGARNTLFENLISDPDDDILRRDGDIGDWEIVALADGTNAFLSTRFTNAGERPDGSLEYYTTLMLQRLDSTGGLIGEAFEVARFDDAYPSFVDLLDAKVTEDGALILITSSIRSSIEKHIVPAIGTDVVSVSLFTWSDDPITELRNERTPIAEIRPDGGVVLLRGGELQEPAENREDVVLLSTYTADGQSEGPEIRLPDNRSLWQSQLNVTADGLISAIWAHLGEDGSGYGGSFVDGAAFQSLSPRVLTDDADVETLITAEFIDGADGNDTLTGSDGGDRLIGGAGNDLLSGGLGDDLFQAGPGDDTIHGAAGTDVAFWDGRWEDYTAALLDEADIPEDLADMGLVYVVEGQNERAGDGRNLILSIEELVFANGRLTPDELVVQTLRGTGDLDDLIEGIPGQNDTLEGGLGQDTVRGFDGDDSLSGGEDTDLLEGGSGNDSLIGGRGQDVLVGGDGTDVAVFSGNWRDYDFALTADTERFPSVPELPIALDRSDQAIIVTARDEAIGDDQIDFLFEIENLVFADRSDSAYQILLDAGAYNLYLSGGPGSEVLTGDIGHDRIDGDAGNDTIFGGPGNDELNGSYENDSVLGGLGDDTLEGDYGNDTLDGGPGNDWLEAGGGEVDLLLGGPGNDYLRAWYGPTTQEGGEGDDRLAGGSADDVLYGQDGVDTLDGNEANDFVDGGNGDDYVRGQEGNDYLFGREGNDTVNGGSGSDTINGGAGDDLIIGGDDTPGFDLSDTILAGEGNDHVLAGAGNDQVFGQEGDDRILGGFGADTLVGQDGNDTITGGALSDMIFGSDGNDFVNGGFGHDRINGGSGADQFFHVGVLGHGSDWVQDYVAADSDVLLWGGGAAVGDFQVNFAHTANDAGERSGDDAVQEAFVIYRPTEQIIWALVDGEGQSQINLQIDGETFDLLT